MSSLRIARSLSRGSRRVCPLDRAGIPNGRGAKFRAAPEDDEVQACAEIAAVRSQ
ncbi:MAG: hypothetical protein AB2L21_01530 [Anaerolineaceae bacterium]